MQRVVGTETSGYRDHFMLNGMGTEIGIEIMWYTNRRVLISFNVDHHTSDYGKTTTVIRHQDFEHLRHYFQ